MTKKKIKDTIAIYSFIIPMITRWILPVTIERLFVVNIGEIPIYIFDLFYLAIPFLMKSSLTLYRSIVLILLFIKLCLIMFGLIINISYHPIMILVDNQFFIITFVIILLYPFTKQQIQAVKWPLIIAFLIIAFEIILGSLGLVRFGDEYNEFSGVLRVGSTIGAATGTSVILFALGALIFSVYLKGLYRHIFLIIWIISISLTVSRGGFLALIIFLVINLYKYFKDKDVKIYKRYILLVGCVFVFVVLFQIGVFNPIFDRVETQNSERDVSTGRDELFKKTLKFIPENPFLGVGSGNVFPEKNIEECSQPTHFNAPHNYYLIILAEEGYIGFLITLLIFLLLIFKMDFKNGWVPYIIIIIHIILMNVEGIFSNIEFISFVAFLYAIGIYKLEEKKIKN